MSRLISRLFNSLIRLAGGRPEVVRPLFEALEKANAGQNEILRERNTRKTYVSGPVLRILTLVASVLGSIVLTVLMVIKPGEMHPPLGVMILVVVHYLVVMGMVIAQAGPGLLAQDDGHIIGWWPLTRREQLLGRICVILKPALEVTVAISALPLLAFVVTGNPPVLAALVFATGLIVQAIGVTFGVTSALLLMVRWFGRRKAERLVGMVSSGPMNILMLSFMLSYIIDDFFPWVEAHPWGLALLPPVWFAAWGDLTAGTQQFLLADVGLLMSFLMVWAGMRLASSGDAAPQIQSPSARPHRFSFSALVSFLLKPLMRGEEGWAVRKLLEAHLREDWRFIGSLMMVPAMLILFGFGTGDAAASISPEDVEFTALLSSNMLLILIMTGAMVLTSVQYSSTPEALWLVALADLDTTKILDAQRGMIRGLIFIPGGIIYAIRALEIGATWQVTAIDIGILALEMDLMLLILQPWLAQMPFSTGYTSDHSARRVLHGFLFMAVASVFLAADFAYARIELARYILWGILPLLWLFFRLRLKRVMKKRRLQMDVVIR